MKALVGIIILIVSICWVYLLVSDSKLLLSETKVNPGGQLYVEGYGNLGANKQASLVCKYFNGRKLMQKVFWYSPNNFMGRDSCPFILKGS